MEAYDLLDAQREEANHEIYEEEDESGESMRLYFDSNYGKGR